MIIPGFQIERELGRSALTNVYLALQLHPFRRVALKVAHCDLADAKPRLAELEAHITLQPGFRHPRIAHIHGAGAHENLLYLVMEYLEGGDLEQNLGWGMSLNRLLTAYCAVCDALDHAHSQGVMHGRIKLANVLFRTDVEAVLADFCPLVRIADRGSSADLHQRDFRAPEQLSGVPKDPRSDWYSLGASLYTALTGKVAQRLPAGSGREPDAGLPSHLSALQPVIDQALAVDLEARHQSGETFKGALDEVMRSGVLDGLAIKTGVVTDEELRAMAPLRGLTPGAPAAGGRPRAGKRISPLLGAAALAALLGVGGFYLHYTQPLWFATLLAQAGLVQDPAVETAWADAETLRDDLDQGLPAIVAAYRRVLELDADHASALEAIAGLAEGWSQGIQQSLAVGAVDEAAARLTQMEVAFPGDERLPALQDRLSDRRAVEALLASTKALLRNHGLSQAPVAAEAIQTYQEVLRLVPGHSGALTELAMLAEHYANRAREAAVEGDVEQAIVFLEMAATANDELPILALVREQIQRAATALAAIDELLQQASDYRVQGLLVHPQGENAAQLYHRVLAAAPDNSIAQQGLNEVTSRLINEATQMLEQGDLGAVAVLLDRAGAAGIDDAALQEVKASLQRAQDAFFTVNQKLEEARDLLRQGFITEPQDNNAVALLREIQRLQPNNEQAAKLLRQAAARLAEAAQEAFAAGLREQAKHYLDLAVTVTPDAAAWRELRQSWQ